ncbi:zinc-dependent alcohol dehydrogenase [Thiocapsa rosea]|uniref:2-desacetyl-2-hydroxyethyl bacteriochlorophyllide A dehydrogenase n=1 Tax=Thiocapsa rosea TaxID=69360 RepID=A0A495VCZ9_9GAMM|nr:zinc-binding alcohol dehydrogenase [Thiocapsa rosea]RKT46247.1 2-desacetyl-2-hydroxyethyl bacteriochlorophyllide A dehydrogenase [Thiocapsa rosea]
MPDESIRSASISRLTLSERDAPTCARAYWVTGPLQGELREGLLAPPGPGEALVRTLYTGISRGTEALVLRGEVPPSEYAGMRAPFQAGDFPWPVKYGYCNVGRVEAGPADWIGQVVFCLYPHQSAFCVPVEALHRIPDAVAPGRAVLAANLETAVNGLWDAAPRIGDRIAVIGAGSVGVLCAWLAARIPGCRVELIDINPRRADIAERLGVDFALPADARGDVDLVIHASGSSAGLEQALALAGFEATVLELSWYGTTPVTLTLGAAFHRRRLTLRSSQVGQVATAQRARWDYRRRLGLALSLLADPALDVLISGEDAFDDLPAVQVRLATDPGDVLMHRIRYS